MAKVKFLLLFFSFYLIFGWAQTGQAKKVETNAILVEEAPQWLNRIRLDKVVKPIQTELEWTIRKVPLYFHKTNESFQKVHSLGPNVQAVSIKKDGKQSIHLSPQVNDEKFDGVFGHELVHIIIFQKYRDVIPKWLEEGLANHLAKRPPVDYQWLSRQEFPKDVRKMIHPHRQSKKKTLYHYRASQALAEMLDKKCNMERLLQMSLESRMENYIKTYCEIPDLSIAFKEWVKEKAAAAKESS